jgi:hypothetical protein
MRCAYGKQNFEVICNDHDTLGPQVRYALALYSFPLQLLQDSQNVTMHPSDGSWCD